MKLLVQTFLQSHSLQELKEQYGIRCSGKPGDRVFSLNYDQIWSKPGALENQCRGLVLGVSEPLTNEQIQGKTPIGETVRLAHPFDRFFNHGDTNAANVDFEDRKTVFFEKLDGTLCIVWFDSHVTEEWQVATRSVPYADRKIDGWGELTFKKLFVQTLREVLLENKLISEAAAEDQVFKVWSAHLDPSYTYMFELTTPHNRIVVQYPKAAIHILGIRGLNGVEIDPTSHTKGCFGIPVCPSHKLSNTAELLSFVGSKPPFEQEGVVVRDPHFNRVKIKSVAYLAYNRVRDDAANSPRAIIELILSERLDDVLPVLEPHIKTKAIELQEKVRNLFKEMEEVYLEIMNDLKTEPENERRKLFALEVRDRNVWMGPMIDRFLGRCNDTTDFFNRKKSKEGQYPSGLLDTLLQEVSDKKTNQ